MDPVFIIGTGLAGYTLAKELRRGGWDAPLVLVTADDGRYYSKPMLSSALSQGKDEAGLTQADAVGMARDLAAEVWTRKEVTAIDPAAHLLTVGGESHRYGHLVLALGSSPIRLPLKGDGAGEVLSVNNLSDYGRFLSRLQGAKRVAIIGPGLIGCEFANDLLVSGRSVTLIGPDKWPIGTLVPEAAGRAVQRALVAHGATWHLETFNGPVERRGSGLATLLGNGSLVEAEVVLSAVGVRPVTALASAAGLAVNRGIVTDRFLRTSAADVYALGDCAEVDGRLLPFVAPLMVAARALAKTLAGIQTPVVYPLMPVAIKTSLHPVVVLPPPPGIEGGRWDVRESGAGVAGRYVEPSGKLRGFA
ncbi:MAG: FAD-dependent oxidoreductase, partial [Magnetococcales bacterium]|nr:FAD-dependent oxidoreductase [Magnetococcales bacterium]